VSITSARREIERELAAIEQRRLKLQAVLDALQSIDGSSGRGGRPPKAPAAKTSSTVGNDGARSPRGETARRIIEHLRAHPEDRGTAIAAALGLGRANVNNTLTKLKRAGRLKQEGERLVVVD
jgi:DNA-binding transcriptional ArsR family regulator